MKVLYLDESGDHNLKTILVGNSAFVIGGIIVDRSYARSEMEQAVRGFKQAWFGNDTIILHSMDINQAKKEFRGLRHDPAHRNAFMDDLKQLLANLNYEVVACLIHKDQHLAKYNERALDPYNLGLEVVVERFCFEIGDVEDGGIIYAEKRRPDLDHNLDVAWETLRARGTYHVDRGQVDKRIVGLSLKAKSVNIAGLQLADLVVSAIGRHAMGRDSRDFYGIVRSKMCNKYGKVDGYGLITMPK